jgi:hypothetical protein
MWREYLGVPYARFITAKRNECVEAVPHAAMAVNIENYFEILFCTEISTSASGLSVTVYAAHWPRLLITGHMSGERWSAMERILTIRNTAAAYV